MSAAQPYSLETFEEEFSEKVSVHDVPSDVIERLIATVRALREKTAALEMAQIAVNNANAKRDELIRTIDELDKSYGETFAKMESSILTLKATNEELTEALEARNEASKQ